MVTFGPRVEFRVGKYPRLRVWDSEEQRDHYLYLHRLTAYAHGEMDSLWNAKEVNHIDKDSWNNHPENLEAVTREEHEQKEPHVSNLKEVAHPPGTDTGDSPGMREVQPHR